MMRVVLMCFVCGSVAWTPVYAGPGEVVANSQELSSLFTYSSDHYRDPFVPKSVVRVPAGSSEQRQEMSPQTVKVVGTMSSARGRWALLEFKDGERLIVMPGQVIPDYSRVVKRITDKGVMLSAIGDKASPQAETMYWLDEERDFGNRVPQGIPESPEG